MADIIREETVKGTLVMMQAKSIFCPLIQSGYSECFCNKMGSQDIEKTIHYCGCHFRTCDIYKSRFLTA